MNGEYTLWEVLLYTLLLYVPYMLLAVWPFWKRTRLSKTLTACLMAVVLIGQIALFLAAEYLGPKYYSPFDLIATALYSVLFFIFVNEHLGKLLFSILMYSNFANLSIVAGKFLQGFLFPSMQNLRYHWSYSLCILLIDIVFVPFLFYLLKKDYEAGMYEDGNETLWNVIWILPAVFYVVLFMNTSAVKSPTMELYTQNRYALATIATNIGELIIYRVIAQMAIQMREMQRLSRENHALEMQTIQYGNLNERIEETRKLRHDLRHHLTILNAIAERGDIDMLREYLEEYQKTAEVPQQHKFCENVVINTILSYFEGRARNREIEFIVMTAYPRSLNISNTDISVLFGNLLENALEATKTQKKTAKRIAVGGRMMGDTFFLTVENTYGTEPKQDKDGHFKSTKHAGNGIGTESVREIAARYNGSVTYNVQDGLFNAEVVLNLAQPAE